MKEDFKKQYEKEFEEIKKGFKKQNRKKIENNWNPPCWKYCYNALKPFFSPVTLYLLRRNTTLKQ